jgi:hypothetical protein
MYLPRCAQSLMEFRVCPQSWFVLGGLNKSSSRKWYKSKYGDHSIASPQLSKLNTGKKDNHPYTFAPLFSKL